MKIMRKSIVLCVLVAVLLLTALLSPMAITASAAAPGTEAETETRAEQLERQKETVLKEMAAQSVECYYITNRSEGYTYFSEQDIRNVFADAEFFYYGSWEDLFLGLQNGVCTNDCMIFDLGGLLTTEDGYPEIYFESDYCYLSIIRYAPELWGPGGTIFLNANYVISLDMFFDILEQEFVDNYEGLEDATLVLDDYYLDFMKPHDIYSYFYSVYDPWLRKAWDWKEGDDRTIWANILIEDRGYYYLAPADHDDEIVAESFDSFPKTGTYCFIAEVPLDKNTMVDAIRTAMSYAWVIVIPFALHGGTGDIYVYPYQNAAARFDANWAILLEFYREVSGMIRREL